MAPLNGSEANDILIPRNSHLAPTLLILGQDRLLSLYFKQNLKSIKNVLQFLPISAHNQRPPIALANLATSLLNAMGYMVT